MMKQCSSGNDQRIGLSESEVLSTTRQRSVQERSALPEGDDLGGDDEREGSLKR
jgi:hypothetical protein